MIRVVIWNIPKSSRATPELLAMPAGVLEGPIHPDKYTRARRRLASGARPSREPR